MQQDKNHAPPASTVLYDYFRGLFDAFVCPYLDARHLRTGPLFALSACAATADKMLNQPGEFTGKIVGPLEFGQPAEGAGLKASGIELAEPLKLDDKAECGEQTASVLAVEGESVAAHVSKTVVLRATPYCRVSRSGKYHLKDVTVR